jgi:peptide/nickel transport system substrate-binding protein
MSMPPLRRALVLAAALLLAACQRSGPRERVPDPKAAYPPAYGDTLVQGTIADPAILNPVLASDSASHDVTDLVFNSLLRYDENLQLEGELAERWDVSPDGKVITFHLRPGIKWQDGKPLTAVDVKFTYDTYVDPQVKTAYRSNYTDILKAEAVDDLTFRVWYREPFAPALQTLAAMSILPAHLLAGKDINTADAFNTRPLGSGRYRFVDWKRAESVSLASNPDYFEGRPYLDRVLFRVIPDMAVQFLELQNGSLDMIGLTPNQYNREGDRPEFLARFNKYRYPSNNYTYLGFNLTDPRFADPKVRRAIALAIDKRSLISGVLEGLGTVATGPYTPMSWGFDPAVPAVPYDPAAARVLLGEAGFLPGPDGVLRKDGRPFTFTLLTNQGNQLREQTATIIQSQLQAVGIKVEIRVIAWSTLLAEFINKRKFDALIMGWSMSLDPDLYDIFHSSKTGEFEFNFTGYRNPEVDRLLLEGRRTFDQAKRTAIYHRIHALIAADLPYVFLYVPDSLPTVHRRVLGIKAAKAGIGYNFIKWYVPKGFQKYEQ